MPPAEPPPQDAPAAPDAEAQPAKKSLLGWLSGAVSNLEAKAEEAAAPRPEPPKPGSGPLTTAKSPSGPLGGPVRSASLKLPGSGPLARPGRAAGTGDLEPPTPVATPSGPLPLATPLPGPAEPAPAAPAGPKAPEDPATASRRRMAFIVAYMKDPASDPEFADKPLVYRVFSEEREYQQQLVNTLKPQLERFPAGDDEETVAKRTDLETRLRTAQNRQSQLFLQLKKLTGVKGKTGGTGFLTASDVLPEPKGLGGEGK